MAYSKSQLYYITQKLYKELKSDNRIILEKIRKEKGNTICGKYEWDTETIRLDYRYDIISTLIHEYLHRWNPDKSEKWVLRQEKQIINSLSPKQIKNLIKAFGNAI